jgi:hypothetical protein
VSQLKTRAQIAECRPVYPRHRIALVPGENPLLARIVEAGEAYGAGSLSVEELQVHISGNMSAIEGDVPKAIRDAAFVLEANIDTVRFTVDESSQHATITELMRDFASLIAAQPPDVAPSP